MASAFQSCLALLQLQVYRETLELQPNVDEKGIDDEADFQQAEDLSKGAILKATLNEGSGEVPATNDLVFLHLRIGKGNSYLTSTRPEDGGQGHPQPFILGKSKNLLKGLELAVRGYAYQHRTWVLDIPPGLRKGDTIHAEVELVEVVPGRTVRAVLAAEDTFKVTEQAGRDFETPRAPYKVKLHLRASTPSSDDRPLGASQTYFTMQSLDAALHSMVRGERSIVTCPHEAASGGTLVPDPDASGSGRAEFAIELLDFTQVRDLTGSGELVKTIMQQGEGVFPVDCPVEDSLIQAHWRVRRQGTGEAWVFDTRSAGDAQRPIEFDTGMATVPDAVDMAGVTEGDTLEFEVELVHFERDQIREDTTTAGRLTVASKWKDQGNMLFKRELLKLAKAKYLKASKVVERIVDYADDQTYEQSQTLQASRARGDFVSCYLNLALCATKQREAAEAIHYCNKALEVDPACAKALFRRAAALALVGEYASAREDLQAAVNIDASLEPDAKRETARLASQEKAQAAKQRKGFGRFFK
ncbi:Peptidyl-prolyl cis-trans isomerase PASTICCINO1 [Auxenochlorella protothecoides]|uniref:Peptidyl-prolyl cis-trans isomerase PASTICCINO1 n=1 Tax=Auxenochlorella protothecoides TaxID=3075 RepID=A0A087SRF6_AUXPR|nr:Peptidyl-prolyl cis-trans isomerase PASTICCINO1 [Auxenochlorella protothecoides]KFM28310.1 Peptidyl-prolyl cis-trans isomerase PASTICCINO1 [Auxenochlorella protothecoides]